MNAIKVRQRGLAFVRLLPRLGISLDDMNINIRDYFAREDYNNDRI